MWVVLPSAYSVYTTLCCYGLSGGCFFRDSLENIHSGLVKKNWREVSYRQGSTNSVRSVPCVRQKMYILKTSQMYMFVCAFFPIAYRSLYVFFTLYFFNWEFFSRWKCIKLIMTIISLKLYSFHLSPLTINIPIA